MPRLTGGQALVQALKREGVEVVFGLPGVQLDWAFDALYDEQDSIRVVHTRHEQGTSYMADGYARSTGKVGVCLVVPGPGLLNAGAGLSTAYATNSRVLCIAGQIPTHHIGKERGALHEIKNQLETIGSVTKWAGRAMNTSDVPGLVREAFYQLNSGRPRPVEIEVPIDVLMTPDDVEFYEPGMPHAIEGDPDQLEKAAQALGNSQRPLIFVGGGIISSEATAELQELAEMLGAPVIVSQNGRGALSDRHPLALPSIAAYDLLPNADVVLAVGTRFVMPGPNPYPTDEDQTVIHIDIDDTELNRNSKPDIGIVADARGSLADLIRRVPRHNKSRDSRDEEMAAARATVQEKLAVHVARFRVRRCDSHGAAGGGHLRDGGHAGWVLLQPGIPRVLSAQLHRRRLPGHARIRFQHGPRRQGWQSGSALSSRFPATVVSCTERRSFQRPFGTASTL